MLTCAPAGKLKDHCHCTCNPIDVHPAEVNYLTVMTNRVHDECQTLVHELVETR